MTTKIYTLESLKKLRPKIRISHWHGVIVCRKCKKIIKQYISPFDIFRKNIDLILCRSCALEIITKIFKKTAKYSYTNKIIIEEPIINS